MPRQGDETNLPQEESSKRQERANRILDATAELIQRWGYKKTTIDDIARQAGVAKGTIYLHWKTREDLFVALLIRERLAAGQALVQQLASDSEGGTLHGMTKYVMLAALKNPLLKAVMLQDTEMLGGLVRTEIGQTDVKQRIEASRGFLEHLRSNGLIRTDLDLDTELYMLTAITTGFMVVDQFMPENHRFPIEAVADMAAEAVRRAFEAREPTPEEQQEAKMVFRHVIDVVREQSQKELES